MMIIECKGNEERKQRQANRMNTQKKAKQTGRGEKKQCRTKRKQTGIHLSHFLFIFKAG
jgi:hypothetical protein